MHVMYRNASDQTEICASFCGSKVEDLICATDVRVCVFLHPQREEHVRSSQHTDVATRTALRNVPRRSSAHVYQEKWPAQHGTNLPV